MCNIGTFTALLSISPNIMRNREILKTLANMYDGPFSTEPCVALACLELDAYSET